MVTIAGARLWLARALNAGKWETSGIMLNLTQTKTGLAGRESRALTHPAQ